MASEDVARTALEYDARPAQKGAADFKAASESVIASNRAVTAATEKTTSETENATKRQALAYASLQKTLDAAARRYDPLAQAVERARKEVEKFEGIAARAGSGQAEQANKLLGAAKQTLAAAEAMQLASQKFGGSQGGPLADVVKTYDQAGARAKAYAIEVARVTSILESNKAGEADRTRILRAVAVQYGQTTPAIERSTGAIKLQSYQVANLGQQFQDVAVQLAGGQNPFLIALQQGPQAAYAVGGFANAVGLLGQAWNAVVAAVRANPITAAVAVAGMLGAAYLALRKSTDEVKVSHDAYGAALQAVIEFSGSAAEAANRLTEARRATAKFDVNASMLQEANNLVVLETRRAELAERIASIQTIAPGRSPSLTAQLPALLLQLHALDVQIRDVTLRQGALQESAERLAPAYSALAAQLAYTHKGLVAIETEMERAHTPDVAGDLARQRQILDSLKQPADAYAEAVRNLGIAQATSNLSQAEAARFLENLNNWLWQTSDAYTAVRSEIAKAAKASADLEDAQEAAHKGDVAADLKKREEVLRGLRQPMDDYVDRMRELNSLQAKGLLVGDAYARSVENLNQWLADQDPAFQAAAAAAKKYAEELQRVVDRTTDRMVDFGADAFFDVLEGRRDDFWASMVTTAKRAFAQMAAEALLRPIFLPIVQGVVGSAPGLFGLQGGLGSFAQGAAQAAGSSLFGGSNPISSLISGIRQMFSPDNFIANAFPSLFGAGGLTGLTSAGSIGVFTSEAALAGAGAGTGALAGAGPLAGMAPFLPMLAIALPLLLSFFGGKKSVGPNSNAIVNFERDAAGVLTNPGGLAIGGLGADNGGDREYARKMAEAAVKTVNAIADRVGGRITGVPGAGISGQLELGVFQEGNKNFSIVGGVKAEFGSAEEAVADFARRTLQAATIEGLSPDVRLALSKSVAASVEDLGKDIDFAYGFRRQVDLAAAGPGTRQAQLLGFQYAGEDAASQQRQTARDFLANARRLFGEDSTQFADARATLRAQALAMVNQGPDATLDGNKPLEGIAAQVAATRAQFQALKDVLIDTGLSAEEAQDKIDAGIRRTFRRIAADQDKAIADAILAAESPAAAGTKALMESQKARRTDYYAAHIAAGDTVIDDLTLDRLDRLEAGGALIGMTAAQLDAVAAQMAEIGPASAGMQAALVQARAFAAFVEGFGAMQVDIARWNMEAQQDQQRITEAETDAAAAKQAYIAAIKDELSAVESQIQAQEQLKAQFTQLAETMRATRLGLLIDPNLSPLSLRDRLAEARSQFTSTSSLARLGDTTAMARLPDIARAFLETSKEFNRGNADYFTDFSLVQQALVDTESVAERHARIASDQTGILEAQKASLESLLAEAEGQSANVLTIAQAAAAWQTAEARARDLREGTGSESAARGAQQFTAFETLAGQFRSLYAGAASQAERDQIYQAAAQQRDALLGAISDIATLQKIGQTYYQGNNTDSGAIYLRSLLFSKNTIPAFEHGGDMVVGGLGGADSQIVTLRATPGERIAVRTPGQAANDDAVNRAIERLTGEVVRLHNKVAQIGGATVTTLESIDQTGKAQATSRRRRKTA